MKKVLCKKLLQIVFIIVMITVGTDSLSSIVYWAFVCASLILGSLSFYRFFEIERGLKNLFEEQETKGPEIIPSTRYNGPSASPKCTNENILLNCIAFLATIFATKEICSYVALDFQSASDIDTMFSIFVGIMIWATLAAVYWFFNIYNHVNYKYKKYKLTAKMQDCLFGECTKELKDKYSAIWYLESSSRNIDLPKIIAAYIKKARIEIEKDITSIEKEDAELRKGEEEMESRILAYL
ncbi:MAG: hypothetical protein V4665_04465 [Patescibacteria group bacterium]